ncbi:MAG: rRNA maturation RNase YbeY [Elusimicrobiota bacterium]
MLSISLFFISSVPEQIKRNKSLFKKAISLVLNKHRHSNIEVNLIFTNSPKIKKINKCFLNKNSVTDVIAFNYHPEKNLRRLRRHKLCGASVLDPKPFGDIYVCIDRAKKQAKSYNHSLLKELLILTVHGTLHLTGMDDKTHPQRKKMESGVHKILSKLPRIH